MVVSLVLLNIGSIFVTSITVEDPDQFMTDAQGSRKADMLTEPYLDWEVFWDDYFIIGL